MPSDACPPAGPRPGRTAVLDPRAPDDHVAAVERRCARRCAARARGRLAPPAPDPRGRARGPPAAIFSAYVDALLGLRLEPRLGCASTSLEQLGGDLRRAGEHGARIVLVRRSGTPPAQRSARRRAPRPSRGSSRRSRASPAMIARSTGAAPRQRGSSDGCTFSHSARSSSARGISSPYAATTTLDVPSISGRSGCRTGRPSRSATTFAGGGRARAHARRARRAASAGTRCSCREPRRSRTSAPNGAVAATPMRRVNSRRGSAAAGGRRAPPCARRRRPVEDQRAVEVVGSCCTTRAGCPSSSSRSSSPSASCALERQPQMPLDRHRHALQRQAALVVGLELVAQLRQIPGSRRRRRSSSSRWKTKTRWRMPDLVRREADAARVVHQLLHPRRRAASRSSSNAVTSCARMRSTGSPYWRICASASCRRAAVSASSSPSSTTWPSASSSAHASGASVVRGSADRRRRPRSGLSRRIAGAAAASSRAAADATARGRSVLRRAARGSGRAGGAAARARARRPARPGLSSASTCSAAPASGPRRRSARGGGTADSRARAAARARRRGSPARRGAPRARSRARRAGTSGRGRGPARRGRCGRRAASASWNVRSSARKSGRPRPVSASTTAASATPAKWWPFATICVPSSTARVGVARSARSVSRDAAAARPCRRRAGSASSLGQRRLAARARAAASRRRSARARPTRTPGRLRRRLARSRSGGSAATPSPCRTSATSQFAQRIVVPHARQCSAGATPRRFSSRIALPPRSTTRSSASSSGAESG